jgi:hypothetical protein
LENSKNQKYKNLTLILVVAIAAVFIFAIIPNYFPGRPGNSVEKIDFTNSAWIEQYIEENIGLFGKDFYVNTAFSYNIRSNKMIATYASQNTVEEAREHYLTLPGAEQFGRNDETSLNVVAEIDGQDLRVYNYYSSISRVFELEITLDEGRAEQVISQLEMAFPAEKLAKINGIENLVSGEVFGGYVRYHYDSFSGFAHPYVPIFSRAYFYEGSEDDFNNIINALNEAYPENLYDDTQNANYYKINGQIVSLVYLVTDSNENIVSISIQDEPSQE